MSKMPAPLTPSPYQPPKSSTMPTTNGVAEVVDTRTLTSGILHQELVLTNTTTGTSSVSKRYWHAVPTPIEPVIEEGGGPDGEGGED